MLAKTVFAYGGGQGSQSLRHIRGQHPTTSPMAALARRRPQIHRAATDPACCPLAAHQRISSRRSTPAGASHNSSSEVGQGGGREVRPPPTQSQVPAHLAHSEMAPTSAARAAWTDCLLPLPS